MKHIAKLFAPALALTLSLSLAACGGTSPASSAAPASSEAPASSSEAASSEAPAAPEAVTLKVGASPAPHAEILENIKPLLEKDGITLEIVEFTDYVIPNQALDAGDIDANYFQHLPYLEDFNAKNGTNLSSAGAIHFEPLGLYPGKTASLDDLEEGATVAVPNDTTNEARALLLLQKLELITLKEGVGLEATPLDIVDNPKDLKFNEMEAALLPSVLPDVDLAVINGNYAVGAGIENTVLTTEDKESEAAKEFANVVAVRTGDEGKAPIQKLLAALQSEENAKFIDEKYNGTVIPVF
ncbi:MetQ/NlpA family ABC transporter substrate-binding protein [Anaerotruncus sp. 1XD42-93]|jgi:D-methionine transport system substrate-binding protein|uniref:MetQ/NlpA family ABC transporter substrate-binding protein n=1 Tax=Anaerotruncus sp. 1XD42-93 TaxID=2320853 RepID=UPI000EA3A0EB|nr:MetQ/NlpA family ABC transporter substrate-binding protein [Anaerotruncus sp. 1XD42-93]NBK16978.1 metal ABC transporter substrate-binding protein [Anaerotruncus sp. 1XD42-93]RKK00040.1 metal ABC transporter substrate-binding protein [Anaerotruncus sp. 1XD22-93]